MTGSAVSLNSIASHTEQTAWRAQLDLGFARRDARTVLAQRRHHGPLVVQKPFYPEDAVCHVYIIHPPGGVVGGDQLAVNIHAGANSQALITTPAANKFYRSGGPVARLDQQLTLDANASLEWLPQETIVFNGCAAQTATRVQLGDDSRFIGWEITCLGRPASGENFTDGWFRQRMEVYKRNEPVFIERALLAGGHSMLQAPWGMQSFTVTATLIARPADKTVLQLARSANTELTNALSSCTLIDDVLVCRYLGHHGEQAKAVFTAIWSAIRPACLQRSACIPRIWNT